MGESYDLNRKVNRIATNMNSMNSFSAARVTGTSTGGLSLTVASTEGRPWSLEEVRLHLSAVGAAGNLTVTLDSATAAAYDCVLKTEPLSTITDFHWQPARPILLNANDEVDIAWAATTGDAVTFGLEAIYRKY